MIGFTTDVFAEFDVEAKGLGRLVKVRSRYLTMAQEVAADAEAEAARNLGTIAATDALAAMAGKHGMTIDGVPITGELIRATFTIVESWRLFNAGWFTALVDVEAGIKKVLPSQQPSTTADSAPTAAAASV
jgi:hypothetical protein